MRTLQQLVTDLVNTLNVENGPEQLEGYLNHLAPEFNDDLQAFGLPAFQQCDEREKIVTSGLHD